MKKFLIASAVGLLCVGCNMTGGSNKVANAEQNPSEISTPDWEITTRVKGKIAVTLPSASIKISVTTKNGVVTLIGTVATDEEKNIIVAATKKIRGVKQVNDDQLTVGP